MGWVPLQMISVTILTLALSPGLTGSSPAPGCVSCRYSMIATLWVRVSSVGTNFKIAPSYCQYSTVDDEGGDLAQWVDPPVILAVLLTPASQQVHWHNVGLDPSQVESYLHPPRARGPEIGVQLRLGLWKSLSECMHIIHLLCM